MKEGDGLAVQQFADFLWQCHSALDSLKYLTNLNCQEENRCMACKLPKAMCERCDREVDMAVFGEDEQDFTEEPGALTGRFPTFTEFCKFVGKEARIMVSSCRTSTATPSATAPKKNKATTLVSTPKEKAPADSGPKQCGHCGGSHYVYQCKDFLGKNVEYKKDYAIAKGLCFGCLRSSHMYRSCRIRNPEIMRDHVQPGDERPPRAAALHIDIDSSGAHSTMIVPVWCYHQEYAEFRVLVYALLDSQSSGCFLSEELADRLQMEPDQVTVDLTTRGSRRMVKCGAVQGLRVKSVSRETLSIGLPKCYTRKCIPGNYEYIPQPAMVEQWPHLREVSRLLPEPDREIHFGLLLGFNCSEALNVEEYRRGPRHHPFGALTALGWTVTGCLTHSTAEQQRRWSFGTEVKEVNSEDIRRVFDSEFMSGDSEHRKVSQDDALFDKIMRDGLSLGKDGHFQVPLPFRSAPQNLPDSRPMALRCLMSSKRKMKRDGMFGAQYAEFMNSVISSGQATLVVKPDQVPVGQRWYWCTHAVTHPRKPGKVRGVWDGAAEVQGESINHHLLTGPDQMNNLVGVLAKFRREKVAVTCDIEGMFLQVRIEPSHRRYLRFLWFKDGDPDGDVLEYEMTVLPFGAASSPACAGRVLQETADRFADEFGEQAASFLKDQFYVNDGLGSVPDDAEALALIHNSRGMCAAGGFNLRKFACSSKAVMEAIPEAWRVASLTDLCIRQSHLPNERVLGMLMSLEKDAFLYCVQMLVKGDSRRCYLSALSSLFDPMGLVSPALLPGRLLLQRLCSNKFDWDDPVGNSVQAQWQEWYLQLTDLNGLEIPRCFRRTVQLPLLRRELHVFCDASDYGYGACCYILLTDEQGRCDTSLVYAKSRVAPSKATTIPRLELQAAVLGVKMGLFIAEELQYPGLTSYYWSDSTVVLGYITNESKRFHVYVANRSQFIRSRTSASQWHHVPTEQNPADVASRGATCEQLMYSTLWWHGPAELMLTVAECELKAGLTDDDPEIRRNVQSMASDLHGEPPSPAEELLERYSSWRKCLSVAARCLQFVDRLRRKASRASGPEAPISVFKQRAQNWIVRAVQARAFVDELTVLGRQEPDADAAARKAALRPSSNLYRLDVYLDNTGLLRVGGRLRLAGWPRDMVHPVVVPAAGPLARRIGEFFHESCQHMGVVTTLNSIRQAGIWLIGGKSAVSGIVSTCTVCRRKRGAPVQQKMADLPADRLATEAPFTYVAADLFGPMSVKRGRAIEKWWVCVFVCMASRAVHLEPVASLDVSGFMQAYRRFVARRGPVRSLRCDRGTNFVGASNEQAAALRELPQEQLRDELGRRACDLVLFVFNYTKASNMAGSWKRMIRTVRSAFWVTLRKFGESLYLDVFQTMIAEAEGLVNSRPLTTVDMSDDTTPCAITPAQLLTMKSHVLAPPPGQFDSED